MALHYTRSPPLLAAAAAQAHRLCQRKVQVRQRDFANPYPFAIKIISTYSPTCGHWIPMSNSEIRCDLQVDLRPKVPRPYEGAKEQA